MAIALSIFVSLIYFDCMVKVPRLNLYFIAGFFLVFTNYFNDMTPYARKINPTRTQNIMIMIIAISSVTISKVLFAVKTIEANIIRKIKQAISSH